MTLPDSYMRYERRRRGNDHDFHAYSPLPRRQPVTWPGGKPVALFATVHFDFYPLGIKPGPVMAPGATYQPGPNFMMRSHSDYGARVGAFRLFKALDAHGFKATAVFNSAYAERFPRVVEEVLKRGWEIAASGVDMAQPLHSGLDVEDERALIAKSLASLNAVAGSKVKGWHSPAFSQSNSTLSLLAEAGIEYVMDWVNDDMPYPVDGVDRSLIALPISYERSDATVYWVEHQPVDEIYLQHIAAHRVLAEEAKTAGGRVLSVPLHPEISGQPFRIGTVERLLGELAAAGNVWAATGSEIADTCRTAG